MYAIAVGLLVGALIVAQFLPGKRRALELQADRRREAEQLGLDTQNPVHAADAH